MSDQRLAEPISPFGAVTAVERIGPTVHRTQGAWSENVHRLLDHVRRRGFTGAPRFLGVDERGREILDFIDGTTADDVPSDNVLASAAVLLRRFHDATADGALLELTGWQLPTGDPVEVVCHNDVAPYNCVVRDGVAVGLIDFDVAAPGPRAWDLAYALYRFVPLSQDVGDAEVQGERAGRFLAAYGASRDDATEAIRLVPVRLQALVDFMEARAASGDTAYAGHIARGDAEQYRRDIRSLSRNSPKIALSGSFCVSFSTVNGLGLGRPGQGSCG